MRAARRLLVVTLLAAAAAQARVAPAGAQARDRGRDQGRDQARAAGMPPSVRTVPVAARAIARGEVLGADAIALAPDTTRAVREAPAGGWTAAPRPTAAAGPVRPGWVARRQIAAGEPLRAPAVTPPDAVRHGQPVRVVYRESGLAITISGTAAADAPVGARVAVRVESAGRARRLEGTVIAPGLVQLD